MGLSFALRIQIEREIKRLQRLRASGAPGWDKKITELKLSLHPSPEKPFKPYSNVTPEGSYPWNLQQQDRKRLEQEAGGQIQQVLIPVTATGRISGFDPFDCNADGMQLIARTIDDNGTAVESSDSARIFIKLNDPNGAWLPVGYGNVPQGGAKGDATVFMGLIKRFWVRCAIATQDTVNQPNLIVFLLRKVSIVSPSGSSGLFGGLASSQQIANTPGSASPGGSLSLTPPGGGGGAPGGSSPTGGGGPPGGGGRLSNL